jgi:hypothetical protein
MIFKTSFRDGVLGSIGLLFGLPAAFVAMVVIIVVSNP